MPGRYLYGWKETNVQKQSWVVITTAWTPCSLSKTSNTTTVMTNLTWEAPTQLFLQIPAPTLSQYWVSNLIPVLLFFFPKFKLVTVTMTLVYNWLRSSINSILFPLYDLHKQTRPSTRKMAISIRDALIPIFLANSDFRFFLRVWHANSDFGQFRFSVFLRTITGSIHKHFCNLSCTIKLDVHNKAMTIK